MKSTTVRKLRCLLLAIGYLVAQPHPWGSSACPTYAQSPQGFQSGYDESPFEPAQDRLPPKYLGVDIDLLYAKLLARQAIQQKDEFETTAQFRQRVIAMAAMPLFGSVKVDNVIAAVSVSLNASYDADEQTMTMSVPINELRRINFDRTIQNGDLSGAFRAEVKMDIPTARRVKPNLAALFVFRLNDPYFSEYTQRIQAQLLDIWFYDLGNRRGFR